MNVVNERSDGVQIKHCGLCNIDVKESDWIKHLKSLSYKSNTYLTKDNLIQKVRSFNIRRLRRTFQNIEPETNDYIVKVRRSVRGVFLNIKNNAKE